MKDYVYGEVVQKSIEKYTSKVLSDIHKGLPDSGLRLIRLIQIVPNWETYLTPKQYESAVKYITCLNASEVDYQLGLNIGTTQQRLFGSSTSKGALGALENAVKKLEEIGYFEKQKRLQEKKAQQENKPFKPSKISDKTKEQIKELIKLVIEVPNYENYLTESQKEKIYQFLRLRSIKSCAKYFNISEISFKQSLLGRGEDDGILGRLKKASKKEMVSSWDDV